MKVHIRETVFLRKRSKMVSQTSFSPTKYRQSPRPCLQVGRVTLARGLPWHPYISYYLKRRIYKEARVTLANC